MEIYLVRHTTPDVGKNICYGKSNVDLADTFEMEAQQILSRLPGTLDTVYCSPLKRCVRLAEKIQDKELVIDTRLEELDFGNWEMKSWDQIPPEELNPWMADFVDVAPPNGESMRHLMDRVKEWYDEWVSSKCCKAVVVTHAGPIRALLSIVNNTPLEKAFELYHPKYGEVIPLITDH